jgi:hypothetical protein
MDRTGEAYPKLNKLPIRRRFTTRWAVRVLCCHGDSDMAKQLVPEEVEVAAGEALP